MKRSRFGAAMLLALLLMGILSDRWMIRTHRQLSGQLEQAARQALTEDLPRARELTGQVKFRWEKNWTLSGVFANHSPMEQVDLLFTQLEVYASAGEATAYAAVCAQLAAQINALADAQELRLRNLL